MSLVRMSEQRMHIRTQTIRTSYWSRRCYAARFPSMQEVRCIYTLLYATTLDRPATFSTGVRGHKYYYGAGSLVPSAALVLPRAAGQKEEYSDAISARVSSGGNLCCSAPPDAPCPPLQPTSALRTHKQHGIKPLVPRDSGQRGLPLPPPS